MNDTMSEWFIFVFGSNCAGMHKSGAAKTAIDKYNAIYGVGVGRQGRSYGIPTKGFKLEVLTLREIRIGVDTFVAYAEMHPELDFAVTKIGTGLAGYGNEYMAPLFLKAGKNCFFDRSWEPFLGKDFNYFEGVL